MAFYLLVTITTVLLFNLLGLSFLLFGREWLRAKREGKFARDLGRHEGLIIRLRATSPDGFQAAFRQLAVVPDPDMREAILDRAREEASPESISFRYPPW